MNCRRRQDLPTPGVGEESTSVSDDDEFEHIGEGHICCDVCGILLRKINNWAELQPDQSNRTPLRILINN